MLLNPTRTLDSLDPAFSHVQPSALLGTTNDGLVTFKHVGGSDGVQVVPDLAVSLPNHGRRRRLSLQPALWAPLLDRATRAPGGCPLHVRAAVQGEVGGDVGVRSDRRRRRMCAAPIRVRPRARHSRRRRRRTRTFHLGAAGSRLPVQARAARRHTLVPAGAPNRAWTHGRFRRPGLTGSVVPPQAATSGSLGTRCSASGRRRPSRTAIRTRSSGSSESHENAAVSAIQRGRPTGCSHLGALPAERRRRGRCPVREPAARESGSP